MDDRPYRAHAMLVDPARARPQLWRLFAGLILAGAISFVLGTAARGVLGFLLQPGVVSGDAAIDGNTPGALLALLYSFGLVIIGVFCAVQLLHHRAPLGLIGPLALAIRQFWQVIRALAVLGVVLFLFPPYEMGQELVSNLDLGTWLMLLPLSLSAVLIQTASEEILFRGYIQQSLAARFADPLVWMVVPALLFGLGHYVPADAGDNAGLIALWAVVFGVLMADLTARAGTLGPAIALHMANNVTALLIVSLPDTLSGLALSTTPYSMADTGDMRSWLLLDFGFMLVSWQAARLAIRR